MTTDIIMPKMGESIMEATILKWNKQVGDTIALDESILDIATDKVDSEVPSPVAGVLQEILFAEGETVAVGVVIARIAAAGSIAASPSVAEAKPVKVVEIHETKTEAIRIAEEAVTPAAVAQSNRFYSPLVRSMAAEEGVALHELDTVAGTGANGRMTKTDFATFMETRGTEQPGLAVAPAIQAPPAIETPQVVVKPTVSEVKTVANPLVVSAPSVMPSVSVSGNVEIVEMDRMRKLIADHMVMSKQVSPHVTSFVEADVTNMVKWRDANKAAFERKYGDKITFTPIFIEAVARALRDFPMVNVSVDGTKIIVKKDINIGMAAALPSGNLIVPVIKAADQLNLAGIARQVNDLTKRARANQLKPDDIQGGTFTLSNVGTFGNVMGTPIINQPQAAILAVGAIRKKPAVIETEYGDVIAIRHMMFLSLSYDHRVVDGSLGGSFLRRIGDYLEGFEMNRPV